MERYGRDHPAYGRLIMPTYTVVSTSYCRKRKGLFRRGPLRKQARRAYVITSPSMKAAISAYREMVQVDSGCRLKVYASLKPQRRR